MVILEYPAEFGLLLSWLEKSKHPVLANGCARDLAGSGRDLNLVGEDEAIRRLGAGERVYTCSETALEWVVANSPDESLVRAIGICKDKAALRRAIRNADPDFFFMECTAAELGGLDYASLPSRFVVKPNRGFCSVGVFIVESEGDWEEALAAIAGGRVSSAYPQGVIDGGTYVIEQFVEGAEYALDLYFDGYGAPHVLNVLRHDFASPEDTSDRLYVTSPRIVADMRPRFESWLATLNAELGFSDFCIHAEVRVRDDIIRPIEFNPLRFAGIGGTDISHYAYGFRTYEAYLEDRAPDWDEALRKADGEVFAMSFIMAEPDVPAGADFDLDAFCAPLDHVIDARRLDTAETGAWAFVFAKADESRASSLDHLMNADLHAYVRQGPACL
jgi:hypothetical protein